MTKHISNIYNSLVWLVQVLELNERITNRSYIAIFCFYRIILSDYTNTLYQSKFLFLIIYTQQCWDTQLGFSRLPYGKNHTIPHLSQITFVQNLTFSMLDTDILYSLSYCYKWLSSLFYLWDAHLEENQLVFVFLRITTTQDRSMKNIFRSDKFHWFSNFSHKDW